MKSLLMDADSSRTGKLEDPNEPRTVCSISRRTISFPLQPEFRGKRSSFYHGR